jgi:hypothetical protein
MKEYLLIYRNPDTSFDTQSPEQMQQVMASWMEWLGGMAAKNKIANMGNRLSMSEGKTVKPGNIVTDGPYAEIKEFISGYTIVKTSSLDEAVELAKGCPIFKAGGNVEVRAIASSEAMP